MLTIHKYQECEIHFQTVHIDHPEKYQGLFCQLYIILSWCRKKASEGGGREAFQQQKNRIDICSRRKQKKAQVCKKCPFCPKSFVFVRKLQLIGMRANLIYKNTTTNLLAPPLIFQWYSPPSFLCWLFFFLSRSQEPPEPLLSRFLVFSGQERFFNSEFPKQERFFNSEFPKQERIFNYGSLNRKDSSTVVP